MRMCLIAAACLPLAAVETQAQEATIGIIRTLEGHVTITQGPLTFAARLDGIVHQGDTIRTYLDGSVGVVFKDNTRVALGPSSRMTIPRFVFEPDKNRYGFLLKLIDGTMQYLSGLTAKLSPDSMQIETPTATVAVRGTRFVARAEP